MNELSNRNCSNEMNTIERKIRMAASGQGISLSELARRIGTTPQNFGFKLKRDTLSYDDMCGIADALGCKWIARFEFPDGTVI